MGEEQNLQPEPWAIRVDADLDAAARAAAKAQGRSLSGYLRHLVRADVADAETARRFAEALKRGEITLAEAARYVAQNRKGD